MDQKLIVVLLLVTIVLSITSMAFVFTVNPSEGFDIQQFARLIESNERASVGLVIKAPIEVTG